MSDTYAPDHLALMAPRRFPKVSAGDDLVRLILDAAEATQMSLLDDDVLVVAQKIVSKAEGRVVTLREVTPSLEACRIALTVNKDPQLVEVILRESTRVVRQAPGVLIVEHRLGFVMANAGVDQSNAPQGHVVLLPENPDRSAAELARGILRATSRRVAVIVSDSIGRPWRNGSVGHALGVAGVVPLIDLRGSLDLSGRTLQVTEVAVADEIAAAASLLMGQAAEGKPVVIVRGFRNVFSNAASGRALLRDRSLDLFR